MVSRRTSQSAWVYGAITLNVDAAKTRARASQNRHMHQTVRLLSIRSETQPIDFDVNTSEKSVTGW